MTRLLEEAIKTVEMLPADQQDAIAATILDEVRSEKEWELRFAQSSQALSRLAEYVRSEKNAGRTSVLDLSDL